MLCYFIDELIAQTVSIYFERRESYTAIEDTGVRPSQVRIEIFCFFS